MEIKKSRYSNQLDLIDKEVVNCPISVIGIGGVGSWATLLIAKMGFWDITVYDFDNLENHNVASQFYKESDLGKPKVDALQTNILEQTGIKIKTRGKKEEEIEKGIIVMAVDSMARRIELEKVFKNRNIHIVDGRMGGLQLEIYACKAINYVKTLIAPNEVQRDACTARSISFNCAIIGGLIANYVRLITNGKIEEDDLLMTLNDLILLKNINDEQDD